MSNLPPNLPKVLRALAAVALAGASWLATPAAANTRIEPPTDIARGVSMTQAQCAAVSNAIWMQVMGRDLCMRYYISTAGGRGAAPVVFLQGDQPLRRERRPDGTFAPEQPFEPEKLQRFADGFSKSARTTGIYLARMGVDGSSGNHKQRRTVLELMATNVALDAIRQRHGFSGFHLAGQSGGATLIGSLLSKRQDIGCAVPGAGRLAQLRTFAPPGDPAMRIIDGVDGIAWIVRHSRARIIVVTDPRDARVPYQHQRTFVEQLRQEGGRAEHYLIQATDEHHHSTVAYTRPAVAACIRGASPNDLLAELSTVVRERLAAKQKAALREQANAGPAPQPRPSQQPHQSNRPASRLQGV